jgi:hypothetical protein
MRQVVDRCFPWKYGKEYISALQTTRGEAPSQGRLHRMLAPGLEREMHFLSAAEARVAAWLIYQPSFIEGLENRPCMPISGIAVLDGYPLLHGQYLPKSSGTAVLAQALGIKHPMAVDDRPCEEKKRDGPISDLFPLTSDFLALLIDGSTVRAVNLFIKKYRCNLNLDRRHEELFRLERAYYAEANIPTVKISEEDLDTVVTNNLVRALKLGILPKNLLPDQVAEALLYMQDRIFKSAPISWCGFLYETLGLTYQESFRVFHYGVLRRYLKVDLHEAIAMDRVHRPERRNYAADFAARFLENRL